MPSYNASSYIKEAILSVINQTYSNWELIVTDDCSTDNSYEIALELAKQDQRIQVYKNLKNSGTSVARNNGLDHAKGKYVTFLDSDDYLDPTYLEKQVRFLEENNYVVVSSDYYRLTPNSNTIYSIPKQVDYKRLLKGNPLSCLTTMYNRELLPDVRFPIDLMKCEDYVFWLNILKMGYVAYGNNETLATYRILKTSKSRKKLRLIKYMWIVYRKTQKLSWFYSVFCVFRWALYGLKKYRNVR